MVGEVRGHAPPEMFWIRDKNISEFAGGGGGMAAWMPPPLNTLLSYIFMFNSNNPFDSHFFLLEVILHVWVVRLSLLNWALEEKKNWGRRVRDLKLVVRDRVGDWHWITKPSLWEHRCQTYAGANLLEKRAGNYFVYFQFSLMLNTRKPQEC